MSARRSWQVLVLVVCIALGAVMAQTVNAQPVTTRTVGAAATPAFSSQVVHAETVQVGPRTVSVQFTSTWPPRAQKSFDLIFAPTTGIRNLTGSWKLLGPDGSEVDTGRTLPHYPRDRRYWGLDSVGFAAPGRNTFVISIGQDTGTLAVQVGQPPAGPPRPLISVLALLPVFGVLVLAVRAWRRAKPLRQAESSTI